MITTDDAKRIARELSRTIELSHSQALETIARASGHRDWNTFVAAAAPDHGDTEPVARQRVIPILRIFDHQLAREFYCQFLGFTWDWQHQFEPDLPVYAQVDRSGCVLHLS